MTDQHILLENLFVSERTEEVYAQIIAEEDIGEDYGEKAIIRKGVPIPRNNIF
jgi:hypothetical protein